MRRVYSSEGFTIFDAGADIIYESPANKRFHGYEAHEVMGRSLFDFCMEEDRERIMPLFTNLQPGGHATGTVRFRHQEGHYIYLEGTIDHQLDPRMHGGELSVRSKFGVGSTFILMLPAGCWHLSPEEIELLAVASPRARPGAICPHGLSHTPSPGAPRPP